MKYLLMIFTMLITSCSFKELKQRPDDIQANYNSIYKNIFSAKCTSCHDSLKKDGDLDLSSYTSLMSTDVISPGKPLESELYVKIQNGSMPKDGSPLSVKEQQAIYDWILSGASEQVGGAAVPSKPELEMPEQVDYKFVYDNIFKNKCYSCHHGAEAEGFFEIDRYSDLLQNLVTPDIVVPGNPEKSKLFENIITGDMPRESSPLKPIEIEIIKRWILQGAREKL